MSTGLNVFLDMGYDAKEWRHAVAILQQDYPEQWTDLVNALGAFRLHKSQVQVGGGGKSPMTKALESEFNDRGWCKKNWDTRVVVTETSIGRKPIGEPHERSSPTHEVDLVKGKVALEIEWSNKDPFYDRDLNNFRLLFDLQVISVGVIITKSDSLVRLFKEIPSLGRNGIQQKDEHGKLVFCDTKLGRSTTWYSKLEPRIEGGGGGGCPILVVSITPERYIDDTM